MSDYQIVESLIEDACASYITASGSAALAALAQYKGHSNEKLELPCIVIETESSDYLNVGGRTIGNCSAEVSLTLMTHKADTTRAEHLDLEGDLSDLFFDANLALQLNNQLSGLDVLRALPQGKDRESDENANATKLFIEVKGKANDGTGGAYTPGVIGTAIIG